MNASKQYSELRGRKKADVVIVGGGLSGMTIALWLAKSGMSIAVVEAEKLARGSSACCAGMIGMNDGFCFAELERKQGRTIALNYARTRQSAMQAIEKMARQHDNPFEWRSTTQQLLAEKAKNEGIAHEKQALEHAGICSEISRQKDAPLPAEISLHVKQAALLNADKYLSFLYKQLLERRVRVYEDSRVISTDGEAVYTAEGSVSAPYIVIATGYPILTLPGWYFLRMEQRMGWLIRFKSPITINGIVSDAEGKFSFCRQGDEVFFTLKGNPIGTVQGSEPEKLFLNQYAEPLWAQSWEKPKAGHYVCTADGLPFIGVYGKQTPNMFVACGYGTQGLLGSMMAAQAISARILGLPSHGYDIYWSAGRGWQEKMPVEIAGRYIRSQFIHRKAPKCPHMGCKMNYDEDRRIWQCPCHGSCFDDIGHLLNGPAVHEAVVTHKR